jgi:hypothetical protein
VLPIVTGIAFQRDERDFNFECGAQCRELCVVFYKKCDIELKTECKEGIALVILQTWFRDLVHQVQVSVIAFQVYCVNNWEKL